MSAAGTGWSSAWPDSRGRRPGARAAGGRGPSPPRASMDEIRRADPPSSLNGRTSSLDAVRANTSAGSSSLLGLGAELREEEHGSSSAGRSLGRPLAVARPLEPRQVHVWSGSRRTPRHVLSVRGLVAVVVGWAVARGSACDCTEGSGRSGDGGGRAAGCRRPGTARRSGSRHRRTAPRRTSPGSTGRPDRVHDLAPLLRGRLGRVVAGQARGRCRGSRACASAARPGRRPSAPS